ncbi:MAG TPA: sugar ABC transporter substrate-binding protein [Chloroflexi bacterium]|nr:sugar ABC transporter substrate-binding protein [Chloroflexota bacterium]
MKKSLSLLFAAFAIAALLLSACAPAPTAQAPVAATDAPAEAAASSDTALRVGYAVPDASNPFLSNLTKSVAEYFASDGVEVIVADAQGDATKQVNQIENFITMGVDAIIVMAIDPKGVTSVIEDAQKAGIKVMVAGGDTGVYDAIMHTDQHAMGAMIAQMACDFIAANYADAAEGSVEVGIIENRDTPEANQRSDGMATVSTLCPAATVAGVVGGTPTITFGATAAENLLTAHPNIKVILAYNDAQGLGAAQTVAAMSTIDPATFAIFGADNTPDALAAIKAGDSVFRGTVRFGSDNLALDTYNLVKKMVMGEEFPVETLDPLTPITAANVQ